jgi:hypothetical protein
MKSEQELRRKIMRRVWGMYALRQLTSPRVRLALFGVALFVLLSSVSFTHVFQNILNTNSLPGFVNFWLVAVAHTSAIVQIFGTLALMLMLWTLRDIFSRSNQNQFSM